MSITSVLSCSYLLCCVLGYCCTVLYRKSFRYDQSDTRSHTHSRRQYRINLYLRENWRMIVVQCAPLSSVVCFAWLWQPLFTLQIFHHWCTLLLFIFVSQSISTGIVQLIAPFCVLFVLILGIKTHFIRNNIAIKENEDNESADFTPFNSFSCSWERPTYSTYLIPSRCFSKRKGSVMNRSFGDGVTILNGINVRKYHFKYRPNASTPQKGLECRISKNCKITISYPWKWFISF